MARMNMASRRSIVPFCQSQIGALRSSFESAFLGPNSTWYSIENKRQGSSLAVKDGHYVISKGTGGRSSVSGIIATVFGATGFLGRYVVQQLAKMGSQVMVPFRGSEDSPRHLKLMGDLGQIIPIKFDPCDESSMKAAISKSNVVINLIGRDYETRNFSFDDVHIGISESLSRLSKQHGGIIRYVQASCLGASITSPSKMYRTKAIADEIALRHFPQATILKAGHLVGTEDRLLNTWAIQAKKLPFVPLIGDGMTRLQPVHVTDVAAAFVAVVKDDGSSMGKTYDLGGPDILTMKDLVLLVFDTIREHPRMIEVPTSLAKMIAIPRDLVFKRLRLPGAYSSILSKDYIDSLTADYVVPQEALTFNELAILPRKLQGVAIEHLYAYRTGGPSVGSTLGEHISGAGF